MTPLPPRFSWLDDLQQVPRMFAAARALYGTLETPGVTNNPVIIAWADEVSAAEPNAYNKWAGDWYNDDSTAWCGLFQAVCAVRANPEKRPERWPPKNWLAAASWSAFGNPVALADASLGDICVKFRKGGGHVFQYVAESPDGKTVFGLGGNQGDAVSIAPFARSEIVAARRVPFINRPEAVKKYVVTNAGLSAQREN